MFYFITLHRFVTAVRRVVTNMTPSTESVFFYYYYYYQCCYSCCCRWSRCRCWWLHTLRTDCEFTTVCGNRQLLHEGRRGDGGHNPSLMVSLRGQHFCHLVTRARESEGLTSPPEQCPPNIQLTMETEREGHLPFPETDIYVRPDSTLGHKVYGKPTHINLYLNSRFHPHPSNRHVFIILVHRALCDQGSLHAELVFLEDIFRQNGYTDRRFHSVPRRANGNWGTTLSFFLYKPKFPANRWLGLPLSFTLTSCLASSTSKMEATCSPKTSVHF